MHASGQSQANENVINQETILLDLNEVYELEQSTTQTLPYFYDENNNHPL